MAAALTPAATQPAFCGDDRWVARHLKDRDAERVRRNSPDGGFTAVETVHFDRAEFTKQIQVRGRIYSDM